MGTNGSRSHSPSHHGAGREDLTGAVRVVVVVQNPAGEDQPPTVAAPEGWRAAWVSRYDPASPDTTEDLAVAWDPKRVAQAATAPRTLTAAEEASLAIRGWQRVSTDSHEVWVRPPAAAQREDGARRRHPSQRPAGVEI